MAITGPVPSENARRRNADTFEAPPVVGQPAPELTGDQLTRLRPASRDWWAALRAGPAAHTYASTDWEVAKAALVCHDMRERAKADAALWVKLDARMERYESRLSFTHVDRLKGRVGASAGPRPEVPTEAPRGADMDAELYRLLSGG
ncbi:phage terminase small subunit [Kitasatospora sp. NPDC003701]